MRQSLCFKALTRPVSFMGLPFTHVVILCSIVGGGFIATLSFTYLFGSAVTIYIALRLLATYDARIMDVIFVSMIKTPPAPTYFQGRGNIYRA